MPETDCRLSMLTSVNNRNRIIHTVNVSNRFEDEEHDPFRSEIIVESNIYVYNYISCMYICRVSVIIQVLDDKYKQLCMYVYTFII